MSNDFSIVQYSTYSLKADQTDAMMAKLWLFAFLLIENFETLNITTTDYIALHRFSPGARRAVRAIQTH